jgi:hypothetical protein
MSSKKDQRLSWEDTYREMAREREDWSDLDTAIGDGLGRERWSASKSSATMFTRSVKVSDPRQVIVRKPTA